MRRVAIPILVAVLAVASTAAGQTLRAEERWFYPVSGRIDNTHWRVLTRLPSDSPATLWRTLEVDGSPLGGTRLQVFRSYERNGSVPGTIQEWLVVPSGRTPAGVPMFRLINREVKTCLATTADGDSLSVRPCSTSSGQLWTVVRNWTGPGTTFSLESVPMGLVLEFPANTNGGRVRLAAFRGSSDQALQLDAFPAGVSPGPAFSTSNYATPYQIRPRNADDKAVEVWGASHADGALVNIYAASPRAAHHRFALYRSVTYDYYAVERTSPDGTFWDQTHFLVARHSEKCASVDPALTAPGTAILQERCFGAGPAQAAWYILPAKDEGRFYLFNARTGFPLTVRGARGANGTPLEQNVFTGADNQQFRFVR